MIIDDKRYLSVAFVTNKLSFPFSVRCYNSDKSVLTKLLKARKDRVSVSKTFLELLDVE